MRTDLVKELKKKLKIAKLELNDEIKKQKKLDREADKALLKESSEDFGRDIILPKYKYDENFKVYTEINIPPSSIYKAVGYNDLISIQKIMKGTDEEKHSGINIKDLLKD
jgi:hypothetical protein